MPLSHAERKCALILCFIMVKVALSYLLIIDQLVLQEYGLLWSDLNMDNLIWICAPAMLSIVYAVFLFYIWKTAHYIDWDDRYRASPYSGSKFNFS